MEQVTERMYKDRAESTLRTIIRRRQFLAEQEEALQRKRAAEQTIPAIVVEASPSTPPPVSRDIVDNRDGLYRVDGQDSVPNSPSANTFTPDGSFGMSPSPSPARHDRRVSDISMLSADLAGSPSPRNSYMFDESATQQVISSLSNSIWGEMMQEADEED